MIVVGKFGKTNGSKGKIIVHSFTENPENIKYFSNFYFENGELIKINFIKQKKTSFLTELSGVNSIELAKKLTNKFIYVKRESFPETKIDQYYYLDLIGITVFIGNKKVGKIISVNNHGAGDYCEVKKRNDSFLFPFKNEHLEKVNIEKKQIVLNRKYYSNEI